MTSRFFSALRSLLKALEKSSANLETRPTIGLALGSGGANGLAHIAILQVFDELGIVPVR